MIQSTKQKEIYLTAAQYAARETAGTLEQGVVYHITDGKIDEADLADAVKKGVVFWVNKGVTTYNEVLEAYNAGKLCCFYENNFLWVLSGAYNDIGRIVFSRPMQGGYVYTVTLFSDNRWGGSPMELEIVQHRVTTLSSSSTDTQYPSAKCVYDVTSALDDRVTNISSLGRFLSVWDCTTGLPLTDPTTSPYTYKTGDYYVVGKVGTTNYKPDGATYTSQTASTTIETRTIKVNDLYRYDGSAWTALSLESRDVAWSALVGQPRSNTALANELDALKFSAATTLPETAVVNTHYDLGEQSSLSIVLPSTATLGDAVIVDFVSGVTATSLAITSTAGLSEFDLTPLASHLYQLYCEYIKIDASNYGWAISFGEWKKATA